MHAVQRLHHDKPCCERVSIDAAQEHSFGNHTMDSTLRRSTASRAEAVAADCLSIPACRRSRCASTSTKRLLLFLASACKSRMFTHAAVTPSAASLTTCCICLPFSTKLACTATACCCCALAAAHFAHAHPCRHQLSNANTLEIEKRRYIKMSPGASAHVNRHGISSLRMQHHMK
jgi:hypothetical protein